MKIIVTGAASGIGRAVAARMQHDVARREGKPAELLLVDVNGGQLEEAAAEVTALGAIMKTFVGNLADPDVPAAAVDAARRAFGGLDALISNAGIITRGTLLETSLEDYERTFAVNTRATWLLSKAAYPMLAASKGCIVATASIAAHEPTPALGAYAASKAALVMLIRQLACDWGPVGIRCNTVSPGSTQTGISGNSGAPGQDRREGRNPLRMIAMPEHQAAVIAFLASPEAAFVTGADYVCDGGAQTQLMLASGMGDPWNRPPPSP
jgi:NAD(P)-dependent dehydrogenase (short-subunit alcohol dehydrogenase family)